MKIAIAGDHYTVGLIEQLTTLLQGRGFEIHNLGTKRRTQMLRDFDEWLS